MQVTTKTEFYGIKEGRVHHVGESFEVTPERYEEVKDFVTTEKKENTKNDKKVVER